MRTQALRIPEVKLIEPRVSGDERGWFMEVWEERKLAAAGIEARFVQENHSRSTRWTLRGLHYQIRQPQGKLLRVMRGALFDVAVDLRAGSPTFGHWVGLTLAADKPQLLWVPPGFAHGFLALEEGTELLYSVTDFWAPEHERVLRWDDPHLGIEWPIPSGVQPLLSTRDQAGSSWPLPETYP